MITHICDRCGRPIFKGEIRYIARMELYAAPDPIEITLEDLMKDQREEMRKLIERTEGMTEDDLMQDVYVELKFDLCRACQRALLANPLSVPVQAT
jgi:hypothetical protein